MTFATFGLVVSLAIASVHTSLAHGGNLRIINGWVDKFPIPSDIIWDGRVLANSTLKNFDTYTSKYDPTYVHGNALPNSSMSDFLYLPSYTTNHTSLVSLTYLPWGLNLSRPWPRRFLRNVGQKNNANAVNW